MIAFRLNGQATTYDGDPAVSLLSYLRNDRHLTAAKDGCSGQAACGACLVELNGKACLACSTPMSKVTDGDVVTLEGLPETLRRMVSLDLIVQSKLPFASLGSVVPTFVLMLRAEASTSGWTGLSWCRDWWQLCRCRLRDHLRSAHHRCSGQWCRRCSRSDRPCSYCCRRAY